MLPRIQAEPGLTEPVRVVVVPVLMVYLGVREGGEELVTWTM